MTTDGVIIGLLHDPKGAADCIDPGVRIAGALDAQELTVVWTARTNDRSDRSTIGLIVRRVRHQYAETEYDKHCRGDAARLDGRTEPLPSPRAARAGEVEAKRWPFKRGAAQDDRDVRERLRERTALDAVGEVGVEQAVLDHRELAVRTP